MGSITNLAQCISIVQHVHEMRIFAMCVYACLYARVCARAEVDLWTVVRRASCLQKIQREASELFGQCKWSMS